MQFNSYIFILLFLPITVLLYFGTNKIKPIFGKLVLIVASIFFYSFGRAHMLIYLGISILLNYFSSLVIKKYEIKRKIILSIPIIINIALLLYFKYFNFAVTTINILGFKELPTREIILPLGISFYTFQQIAYIVSVSNGTLNNINLIDYLTYISFFPKLVMGPLVDPIDFLSQLNNSDRKKINLNNIACGIKIFSLGLIKKALIADTFAQAVSWIYATTATATSMDCILLVIFYTFEIYFDFSGYSDMAVGVSSMLNIDLPINFDSPYKALSIRDFWKRWHISLTKFLTKYIYIPLGGSRKGKLFTYSNIFIVFLISGLWHGSNWTFVLWGFLHGLLNCLDRMFEKIEEKIFIPVRWFLTFTTVSVLWLLFSAESITQWLKILSKILFMKDMTISDGVLDSFVLSEQRFFIDILPLGYLSSNVRGFNMIIFILMAYAVCLIPENNFKKKNELSLISLFPTVAAFIWGVLCLGGESTFVYFGF